MSWINALRADRKGFVSVEYTAIAAVMAFVVTKGMHEVSVHLNAMFHTLALAF